MNTLPKVSKRRIIFDTLRRNRSRVFPSVTISSKCSEDPCPRFRKERNRVDFDGV